MGSRYGGLKQVDPVGPNGETVLDYSVYDAARAGFSRVVFVIRRDFEKLFREQVGAKHESRMDVDYAFQEMSEIPTGIEVDLSGRTKPLGTSHAIWCARDSIAQPFGVINADDFYGRDSFATLKGWLTGFSAQGTLPTSMVAFNLANTLSDHGDVSRGVCTVSENGNLSSVQECTGVRRDEQGVIRGIKPDGSKAEFTGDELVSMNFWGFTPEIFPELESGLRGFLERASDPKAEYYIPTAVSEWIEAGKTQTEVLTSNSTWFGVTYREDKPLVEAAIRDLVSAGEYPVRLV